MSNHLSSYGAPPIPPAAHRFGGRVAAQSELALPFNGGDTFLVEGSATINRISGLHAATPIWLRILNAPTFVNSASLVCQGGANIVGVANDLVLAVPGGSGVWYLYPMKSPRVDPPQGRLTLATATPVMVADVTAATTIYYALYNGNRIPIYDGSVFLDITFTELSVATTDTAKSAAAIGASKVNDWFVWNDAGTLRLGHGPDWTNDTTRSAGTALTRVNGIWLNNAAITNGPAASRGTYVGTTRSNASSQIDWKLGTLASGTQEAILGVWNAYNRVTVNPAVADSTASWTYGTGTWRSMNNSTQNRISVVQGLSEDGGAVRLLTRVTNTGTSAIGIGKNSTTVPAAQPGAAYNLMGPQDASAIALWAGIPGLGFNFFQALEIWVSGTFTISGVTYMGFQGDFKV